MNQPFINAAFTKAINDYQSSSNEPTGIVYNSFLTIVLRMLICIYSELDIFNPYMTESEEALRDNLKKFGYKDNDLDSFFQNLDAYLIIENENANLSIKKSNPFFVMIQKQLIDMLICKKMNFHLTEKELLDFYSLLYTPNTKDPLRISYNYLTAEDINEVDNYFKKQMQDNVKVVSPKEKNLLSFKAYEILQYSLDDINKMSDEQIEKVNHQVYDYFKIRENAINKEYLLEKAIEAFERQNSKVTSGNGYVDILLVLGAIGTAIMLISILTMVVM